MHPADGTPTKSLVSLPVRTGVGETVDFGRPFCFFRFLHGWPLGLVRADLGVVTQARGGSIRGICVRVRLEAAALIFYCGETG